MIPLINRLKLKGQTDIVVVNAPDGIESELLALEGITLHRDTSPLKRINYALAFVTTDAEVAAAAEAILPKALGDPLVFFAYPRSTSKRYRCQFHRESGWRPVLAAGFETAQQVALDEDWSLLRFRRKEHSVRVVDSSKLIELRTQRGWNQRELARRAGVSQPYISKLERERIDSPDVYCFQKIADVLEQPLTAFLINQNQAQLDTVQRRARTPKQDVIREHNGISQLKVFICHARSDKPAARELYHWLKTEGFLPWLDEENLLAGQNWKRAIPKAVSDAHVVVVCLSTTAVTKHGFVHKEIRCALDVANEQPEDTIFIIPVRLEECTVPSRLSEWHWVNLYESNGHERLLRALRHRAEALTDTYSQV